MILYFFIFSVSFMTVYLVTPNIRYVALKLSAVDKKSHRKIHKKVITKLGGLAIYIGFLAGLMIVFIFDIGFFKINNFQILGLIICSTLILLLGIYDDFQGSRALNKLIIQFVIVLLLVKIGFRLETISIPGLIDWDLGSLSLSLTVFWLIGIINAINLIDGLDGLAGGIAVIVLFFFCLYGILLKDNFIIFVSLALIGANLAFLKYNFYPAKMFMGDTGSLFLGLIIGSLAIYRPNPENLGNPFFFPAVVILLLPIVDVFLAVIRRILRKQHIFTGDFCHLHHYYIKLGFSQAQTVKRFYIMTFCLGMVSLLILYSYRF